jgi:hypothetical protein
MFGVPIAMVRRAQLVPETRERLGHLERRAHALREVALAARDAAADVRQAIGHLRRAIAERLADTRTFPVEEQEQAEALVGLLEMELTQSTAAAEAAQARAADAGRVAENLRAHLGLSGGRTIHDRSRGTEATA